jgi:putative hydrolase of the HAD superfamily
VTSSTPAGRRIDGFDVVAFDADDTLWRSEDAFVHAEARFVELVGPFVPDGLDVADALRATERIDVPVSGYGVKAFTLSMVRTAIRVTDGSVPAAVLGELVDLGWDMLTEDVHLLPHVPDVLAAVSPHARIALITKGDLVHQDRKIKASGIAHHFAHVEIVLEKDVDTYARIIDQLDVAPERFCMVGNSVRSDILPVLELGGHGIHVPYHVTWEMELADAGGQEFVELASLADVPIWLGIETF